MAEGRHAAGARRFWDRYTKRLHEQGVKPPSDQWHVFRAERFFKAFPDKRLAEITAGEVGDYLARLGGDVRLQPWQFRQAIVAIQNL